MLIEVQQRSLENVLIVNQIHNRGNMSNMLPQCQREMESHLLFIFEFDTSGHNKNCDLYVEKLFKFILKCTS